MKKTIRMKATYQRAVKEGYSPSTPFSLPPVEVDLEALSPAARWIAERITATYVVDEWRDHCHIICEAGFSMAERDRAKGKSDDYIAKRTAAWEDYYATQKMKMELCFGTLGYQKPEAVIEKAVQEAIDAGTAKFLWKNPDTKTVETFEVTVSAF